MALEIRQSIDMNGAKIQNLAPGVADTDAATVSQLNSVAEGTSWKDSVRVATTSNINLLSPGETIDSITMSNLDRVLVKDQTNAAENGIYVYDTSSTAMVRAIDSNTVKELEQAIVSVEEGASAQSTYRQTSVNFTLGTDSILFTLFGSASGPASESSPGTVELATAAEVDAGTDTNRVVTVATLAGSKYSIHKVQSSIGDGTATAFAVTHNFNTRFVNVEIFMNSSPYSKILAQVEYTDLNTVTITFDSAPTSGEFTVSIIG